jgi:hypothetical protein
MASVISAAAFFLPVCDVTQRCKEHIDKHDVGKNGKSGSSDD